LNKVIEKLTAGEVVVSSPPVANGNFEEAQAYGDSDFDMVMFEMEHFGFDFGGLRSSLYAMLNRRRVSEDGLSPSVLPTTRIPATGGETSQWMIKQTLDTGVYGLVVPRVQTPEDALVVVNAVRYPRQRNSSFDGGERGYWPTAAARYWGLSQREYVERADAWPLNPDGELLIVGIIETCQGVENIERILDATNGIGAMWAGPGDLAADMGLAGQIAHPEVEERIQHVREVCSSRGVACATSASTFEDATRRAAEGFQIVLTRLAPGIAAAVRARASEVHRGS
jgi:4-hydroxy-2-oxoheptanedioate aldolase